MERMKASFFLNSSEFFHPMLCAREKLICILAALHRGSCRRAGPPRQRCRTRWTSTRTRWSSTKRSPLPLMRWESGTAITKDELRRTLGRAAEAFGFPYASTGTHSLRIGGACAAFAGEEAGAFGNVAPGKWCKPAQPAVLVHRSSASGT